MCCFARLSSIVFRLGKIFIGCLEGCSWAPLAFNLERIDYEGNNLHCSCCWRR